MPDRYRLIVETLTRGMGGVEPSVVTRDTEYLCRASAEHDAAVLLERRPSGALVYQVYVDDGETLEPVATPEAVEVT